MVRKGNQQKNKVDRHSSSFKKKGSESAVQDKRAVGKADGTKNNFEQELQNGNHRGSSCREGLSEINSVGDEYKVRQNSGKFVPEEQQGLEAMQHLEQSISSGSNPGDGIKNTVGCDAKEDNQTFPYLNPGSQHVNGSFSLLLNRLHLKNVIENVGISENGVIRSLRQLFLSIFKISGDWLERQKPLVCDSRNRILNTCGFIKRKTQLAYPHILKWLMHLGSLLLVFFLVWLDCALRGIGSFVHMGTVSFISVAWCSILSLIAMVGVFKFSIVLVIGALTAAFVGIALGILVLAIMGIVFLWFYGSFWTTTLITVLAGLSFLLKYEHPALLITTVYSVYCAWAYVGWLGLLLGLNLSFISSDVLIYFVKKNIDQHRQPDRQFEQTGGVHHQAGLFNDANTSPSEAGQGFSTERSPGVPSTSGCTSEDEVIRILNCTDHYSALGFTRFEDVDVSLLKREYRKKAMLVHPDKNMGNEKAAEAFKKLQNAYEVLLDSLKRKTYDDELRSEELLNFFRRFQSNSHKNRGHGHFPFGFAQTETDGEDPFSHSRRIACKRCHGFHIWILTRKLRSCARWCQDCNDFHQAKDGDGWIEQSSRPFMFGLLQKVDAPTAFVCADSKIYDVTEWYTCQGMRVPANAHKPSFHVNTSVNPKQNTGRGASSAQKGSRMPDFNIEENMTEEEFVEWLQNAMQSGMFDNFNGNTSTETPAKAGSNTKSAGNSGGSSKRKKKGKKW